jgi:hypothetical protein
MVLKIYYRNAQNGQLTIEEFDFMSAFVEFRHKVNMNIHCSECSNEVLSISESFISHPDVSKSTFELVCEDCAIELEEYGFEIIDEDDIRFDYDSEDDTIPQYIIDDLKTFDNTSKCSICLEEEADIITPCKHYFHQNCLLEWGKSCPMCRGNIPNYYKIII